jgi:ABC-type lipoprotein release transport system permease subunit
MLISQDRLSVVIRPGMLVGAVVGITLLTALGALLPAVRAARLKPVTAMHHIG